LEVVRNANPDILVSTGDLVDGRLSREEVLSRLNSIAAIIAALPTKAGKFAVAGNHEFYAGIGPSLDFTRAAGFTVLRNQSAQLPEGITITGIDDLALDRKSGNSVSTAESELLKPFPTDKFHLLLKHRPVVPASSDGRFDLQLSGHVHKGQLFPFNLLVRLKFPIPCGTTSTAANSKIHVSRGSGTWGPPMRFLAPPEVTIIDILPAPL
jgi:predicted MPP superfamily phosphohydrolase